MSEADRERHSSSIELAGNIVSAYVSNNPVPLSELPSLIGCVHAALVGIMNGAAANAPAEIDDKATPSQVRKSITPDALISFIDGKPYKTLKRHLAGHGLDPSGLEGHNPRKDNVLIALLALAGVTALDVICAQNLSGAPLAPSQKVRQDYRRRSGFRHPAKAMRGVARDFKPPPDIFGPEAMRPWTLTNA
ncbi:MucR family transcriptional regulator [Methylobacterium nigriterrae]|uniref:MucR family transcriptional regulator n=1 Tax=Methylobacterium nigriterrae TaxID=3127512 RepID=UPI003013A2C9